MNWSFLAFSAWAVFANPQDKPLYPVENWEKFSAAERELIAIDQQTIDARTRADAAGLAELLTDDLMLIGENGVRDKASMLKATAARAEQPVQPILANAHSMKYTIRIHGETAVMAHTTGHGPMITHFFVKDGGRWRISGWTQAGTESTLNHAAYALLKSGKVQDAIGVFKTNVLMFPKSANVYDSLGEAYLAAGDKTLALENYRKALEIEPTMASAKAAVERLSPK